MKPLRLYFLNARTAASLLLPLALFSFPGAAAADGDKAEKKEPPPRLTVRLDYRQGPGTEACPTEHSVRMMLNRFFGYDAIQATAAPSLGLASLVFALGAP